MSKKYYLAGPMSGIPHFNFPAFDAACERLRAAGFDIVSPHEHDTPETQKLARASVDGAHMPKESGAESWAECLARDVVLIGDVCAGIIFLPDWQRSRGAKLEAFTGLLTGKEFGVYVAHEGAEPVEFVTAEAVRNVLRLNLP
jgi:hypothetical protein